MMTKQISVGMESLDNIIQNNCYYVDKTLFIRDLMRRQSKVYMFTRPRRFGKTLMLNTIEEFLDIRKDSSVIFKGLLIAEDKEFCEKNQNQYPVLSVSFKGLKATNFEDGYEKLKQCVAQICKNHNYLLDTDKLDQDDKKIFGLLKAQESSKVEVEAALFTLTRMMKAYYGKNVVLLLDEYDVPLAGAEEYGYYDEMIMTIRSVFESVLKTNPYLDFAVITGCLRISKESLFTGVNNLDLYSITTQAFSDMIGFTEREVNDLLRYFHLESYSEQIREWYDGYHFAGTDIYCPWDVMNYCKTLLTDVDAQPALYWKNTSGNAALEKFIQKADVGVRSDFQELLAGASICKKISEQLTYHSLTKDANNIWSLLFLTGYLTMERMSSEERNKRQLGIGEQFLMIPNREMKELVSEIVEDWFSSNENQNKKQLLATSFMNKNSEEAQLILSDMLFETISYFDYKEDFYHAFLAGILSCSGYRVKSNREQGEGRSDILLLDERMHKAVILELKYADTLKNMDYWCDKALQQIKDRKYDMALEEEYDEVLCYGISFYKKRCRVLFE